MEKSRVAGYALVIVGIYAAAFIELLARGQGYSIDPFRWWLYGFPARGTALGQLVLFSAAAYMAVFSGLVFMGLGWSSLTLVAGYYGLIAPILPPLARELLGLSGVSPDRLLQAVPKGLVRGLFLSSPLLVLGLGLWATTSPLIGAPMLLYSLYDALQGFLGLPGPGTVVIGVAGFTVTVYEAILYYTASATMIYMAYELVLAYRAARKAKPGHARAPGPAGPVATVPRVARDTGVAAARRSVTGRESLGTGCRGVRLSELARDRRSVVEKCFIGREIHGYVVEEFIGSGGFGVVLRAHAREDPGDKAALKLLVPSPPETVTGATSRLIRDVLVVARDLEREALSLRELSEKSPYVARLKAIHIDSERLARAVREDSLEIYMVSPPAIIMEYLGGGSLVALLEEARRKRIASPNNASWVRAAAAIGAVVAKALAHVHGSGYVHGDMKPENILFTTRPPLDPAELVTRLREALLSPEKASLVPKLSDLGAAVKTGTPVVQLTPGYAAPELEGYDLVCNELGKRDSPICAKPPLADPSQDIYSLGMIILQLVTGMKQKRLIDFKHTELCRLDYEKGLVCEEEKALKLIRRSKAEPIAQLLAKMLSTDPSKRPTASKVAACLACIASEEPQNWATWCKSLCTP